MTDDVRNLLTDLRVIARHAPLLDSIHNDDGTYIAARLTEAGNLIVRLVAQVHALTAENAALRSQP